MWWADRSSQGSAALLVLLQADSLRLAWQAPASAGRPAAWRAVDTAILAGSDGASLNAPTPSSANGAWRRKALGEACRTAAGLLAAQLGSDGAALPAGLPMVVLASPPWLNEVVMPWADALLQPHTAQDQARAALLAQGCTPTADDELRVDLRPGMGRPRSVLLVPGWLTEEMHLLAQALSLHGQGVQSLAAVAARWAARQPMPAGPAASPLLGLWSAGLLRLVSRDGTPALVGAEWVDDAPPAGQPVDAPGLRVARLWQRAGLRFPALQASPVPPLLSMDAPPPPVGAGPGLHWLPWPGPGLDGLHRAWLQEALRPGMAPPPPDSGSRLQAWPLAMLACLGGAAVLAWQAWHNIQATQALRWPAPAAAPAAVAPLSKAELAELRAVNAAVGRINLAVLPLLRALQPPPDILVSLLSLDLAGTAPATEAEAPAGAAAAPVRLDAQARQAPDMTRYLAYLGSRPGLHGVQLLRHERPQADTKSRLPAPLGNGADSVAATAPAQVDASPASGYRFHLEMSWQP